MWHLMQNDHITLVLITLPRRVVCLIVSIQVEVAKGCKRQGRKRQFFSNSSSKTQTTPLIIVATTSLGIEKVITTSISIEKTIHQMHSEGVWRKERGDYHCNVCGKSTKWKKATSKNLEIDEFEFPCKVKQQAFESTVRILIRLFCINVHVKWVK